MDKAGVNTMPQNWDEFIVALDKVQKAGYVGLAHGGQAWQDATLFDGVVLTTGGVDFYNKAFVQKDPKALNSATMVKAFDRMSQLRSYVDKDFSNRDWNLASAMVIEGKAGFQIMGDWAKGEFLKAKKVPNKDFLCMRVPGTQGMVSFNSDQFMMFKVGADSQGAQTKLAKAIMNPSFQSAFNVVKGSVPARTDVPNTAFDDCGKKGMADLADANKSGQLVGSMAHGHAVPASIKNGFYDVITGHFNGTMTSAAAAKGRGAAVGASLPLSSYRNRILVFLSATAVYTAFLYRSGVFHHNLLLGLDEDERGVERASFSGQYIIPMTLQNQIFPHILFLQIRCLLQLTKF